MNLSFTTRAKFDVELAFSWYERQQKGLGFEFLNCIDDRTKSILKYPNMYRIYYSNFRRCLIKRFPFSIFYTIEDKSIIIHSVFNNKQDPSKLP